MLRYLLDLSSDSTFTWRYEFGSSLAFHHELDAALLDLLLHFNMNLILRYLIFSSISTWTWCRATWAPLATQHEFDATLRDLLLRFDMSLMLRYLIFSFFQHELDAAWQFAVQHEVDATLLDLFLQFTVNLVLRCSLFSCVLIWIWCYVAWSSLAVHREWCYATWSSLPFHSLALCYLIVFCFQWIRCYATWSSLGCRKRPLAPKSESHPQSNPSWSWNVIGRWIWAKHVMASLVFDSILSDQLTLCCAIGEFFANVHAPRI